LTIREAWHRVGKDTNRPLKKRLNDMIAQNTRAEARSNLLLGWNSLIATPPEELLELIASETNRVTGAFPALDDVQRFVTNHLAGDTAVPNTDAPARRKTCKHTIQIHANYEDCFKHKRVRWFQMGNHRRFVESWRDMIGQVCDLIAAENKEDFPSVLRAIECDRRPYFSRNPDADGLLSPYRIKGTDIFVTRNLSANNTKSLCDGLSTLFGYGSSVEVGFSH
jgi:hypothetical protein